MITFKSPFVIFSNTFHHFIQICICLSCFVNIFILMHQNSFSLFIEKNTRTSSYKSTIWQTLSLTLTTSGNEQLQQIEPARRLAMFSKSPPPSQELRVIEGQTLIFSLSDIVFRASTVTHNIYITNGQKTNKAFEQF